MRGKLVLPAAIRELKRPPVLAPPTQGSGCSRRRRYDSFTLRVVGNLGSAADDDVRPIPWLLVGNERSFLVHPVEQVLNGIGASGPTHAFKPSPVGNGSVGLHPHEGIDQGRC